ncbi:hypothetical protein MGYG_06686 [Nannizzia gypsea CBS 118893]|uniref:Uncharacterized protein n=1 Tax=Arthroderma gypseum (strain ATCC MYA-4604 / CBS 118893) TaxID=535722 RepID=E4V0X5_ARTGP|nr:hypothetical protein MGYG_06686 [Nannizzia gypsea CBS 118893]EFR03690.1 hypothetical protein MGYG_06686 [Nannizzia gypsea CBS 118893]
MAIKDRYIRHEVSDLDCSSKIWFITVKGRGEDSACKEEGLTHYQPPGKPIGLTREKKRKTTAVTAVDVVVGEEENEEGKKLCGFLFVGVFAFFGARERQKAHSRDTPY